MKIVRRIAVGLVATVAAVMPTTRADALPRPLQDQWWFSAWGIQSDVWPTTTGAGVTVAVLDTGVNAKLPELSGVVLPGADTTGHDSDGRKDFDWDAGHGTGMAALIAAQGGGTTGYVGIAPEAKILPIHGAEQLGDRIDILYRAFADGIRFGVDHGAKVISISQGVDSSRFPGRCEQSIQDAVSYALQHDVVVVAAAGNSGGSGNPPMMPASCAGVLAVGAIDKHLQPYVGTERQPYVAVAAPGIGAVIGKDGLYYPKAWGTSIAAALTSGSVALIRSRNPGMSARTVVQRLIATARPLGPAKWNEQTGYGAIQITAAMNPQRYPVPSNAPNPVFDAFDKWQASHSAASTRPAPKPSATRPSAESGHARNGLVIISLTAAGAIIVMLVVGGFVWRRRTHAAEAVSTDAR
ncbi:S8 family serine peptidase [Actinoallomurus rhizosphaericola]|uniref:S8 family serine peptidase n=1 Tax=Actinoallomurus rhizosphaericola TaxID=2952536 RepID=UPI0020918011|nr:S8 family serine peptidase [Actinoallomurus rhizosphaericola]MCO5992824.1 S8 family serine peptidase [Actinoallomurus rhizosphaericola]